MDNLEENKTDFNDMFITDSDDFNVIVRYYKAEKDIIVEKIDDNFDKDANNIKELKITFRYPKYADFSVMQSKINFGGNGSLSVNDIVALQHERMFVLFKSWNLECGIDKLRDMNIKIAKSIINGVQEKIGMEGIL